MDTIIKNISVRANYNELMFDSSLAGFDQLDVSRRSFQRIDFRLTDSYGKTINLKNSPYTSSATLLNWYMYQMTWCGTFRIVYLLHDGPSRPPAIWISLSSGAFRSWYLVGNVTHQLCIYKMTRSITLWIIYMYKMLLLNVEQQLYVSL